MNHQRGSIAEGQPLTRFLSSRLSCIYGRGRPSLNTPSRARFESASHPFQGFIMARFPRRVYALPLVLLAGWRMCLGGSSSAVANIQRVQCRLHQLSCLAPPLQQSRDVLASGGADCSRGVYLQYTPLLQTPDPPPPDQDCMRTLTHGECDQLKLC